jgi:hypothetical protein
MKQSPVTFITLRSLAAGLVLAAITVTTAAANGITFANESQTTAGQNWTINSSGTTTTITAGGPVSFNFLDPIVSFAGTPQSATFSLSAMTGQIGNCNASCGPGDTLTQYGYTGTFSFIDTTAGVNFGKNLLSGTFAVTGSPSTTGAQFGAQVGSGSGSFLASDTAGNLNQLVLTSSFINFTGSTLDVSTWSLSSLTPNFAVGTITNGQAYPSGSFTGADSGQFSAATLPASTPEPGTLPLTLIGGGLCALAFIPRHRQTKLAPAGRSNS